MAIHSRGRNYRVTRVVKWAYSKEGPHDLAAVIEEFDFLAGFPPAVLLEDRRGPVGRIFDRLIRRRHYGRYDLKSPIDVQPSIDVSVEINAFSGGPEISFYARTRSQGFILAQMPHDVVGAMLLVLKDYRNESRGGCLATGLLTVRPMQMPISSRYPPSLICVSVLVGVMASGSSLTSMIEGLPLARARSKAGAKSAVSSTVSP